MITFLFPLFFLHLTRVQYCISEAKGEEVSHSYLYSFFFFYQRWYFQTLLILGVNRIHHTHLGAKWNFYLNGHSLK